MGTATYFSPEQAEGIGVDSRSDIYSLGVVLFEMVTGRPPFLGESPVAVASKHVRDSPPAPRELNPSIPPTFEAIILKCDGQEPRPPLRNGRRPPRRPAAVQRGPQRCCASDDATAVMAAAAGTVDHRGLPRGRRPTRRSRRAAVRTRRSRRGIG